MNKLVTMKIKTSELTGAALDWAVARALGFNGLKRMKNEQGVTLTLSSFDPSGNWAFGGPIIEREKISLIRCDDDYETDGKGFTTNKRIPVWAAEKGGGHSANESYGPQGDNWGSSFSIDEDDCKYGPTPLIAAMRCYVASKLGDTVEIPEELL